MWKTNKTTRKIASTKFCKANKRINHFKMFVFLTIDKCFTHIFIGIFRKSLPIGCSKFYLHFSSCGSSNECKCVSLHCIAPNWLTGLPLVNVNISLTALNDWLVWPLDSHSLSVNARVYNYLNLLLSTSSWLHSHWNARVRSFKGFYFGIHFFVGCWLFVFTPISQNAAVMRARARIFCVTHTHSQIHSNGIRT